MIWRFLSDGGNKIQGIRFSQHNQTEHIACLTRILFRYRKIYHLSSGNLKKSAMLLRFLTPDIRMDIISPRVQMASTNTGCWRGRARRAGGQSPCRPQSVEGRGQFSLGHVRVADLVSVHGKKARPTSAVATNFCRPKAPLAKKCYPPTRPAGATWRGAESIFRTRLQNNKAP